MKKFLKQNQKERCLLFSIYFPVRNHPRNLSKIPAIVCLRNKKILFFVHEERMK